MSRTNIKSWDIVVMLISPVFAAVLTASFGANLFVSVLLFFGLPALYISVRSRGIFLKSFIFAFIFSIPLSLFVDALAAVDGSWVIPKSMFPFRFLGVATVEVYLFGLLWVLSAILFYEYFFDKGSTRDPISPRLKYLIYLFSALVLIVLLFYFSNGHVPHIPYFYVLVGTASVLIPLTLFLRSHKEFAGRYALAGLYFFCTLLLFEFVALKTGQWIFPSKHFLGLMPFFGHELPLEELFIWMMAATPALFAYYEFFADDLRLRNK